MRRRLPSPVTRLGRAEKCDVRGEICLKEPNGGWKFGEVVFGLVFGEVGLFRAELGSEWNGISFIYMALVWDLG